MHVLWISESTVKVLNTGTDRSKQHVPINITLLLNKRSDLLEKQSDQDVHYFVIPSGTSGCITVLQT